MESHAQMYRISYCCVSIVYTIRNYIWQQYMYVRIQMHCAWKWMRCVVMHTTDDHHRWQFRCTLFGNVRINWHNTIRSLYNSNAFLFSHHICHRLMHSNAKSFRIMQQSSLLFNCKSRSSSVVFVVITEKQTKIEKQLTTVVIVNFFISFHYLHSWFPSTSNLNQMTNEVLLMQSQFVFFFYSKWLNFNLTFSFVLFHVDWHCHLFH